MVQNYSKLSVHRESERWFSVNYVGRRIGTVELYSNRLHSKNQYLRLYLCRYENDWAVPLFAILQQNLSKPLQVMLSSENRELANFLLAGGFACRRKCYELEVTDRDYTGIRGCIPLERAKPGQPEYTACCQLLYDDYRENHAAVNPLTADFPGFCVELPEEVIYSRSEGQILHYAFVEKNEIAYIGTRDADCFRPFAKAVVSQLLSGYPSIYFECDDCDTAAMALKELFLVEPTESFDTYVRDYNGLCIAEYCSDPCRTASIPYWKALRTEIPENMIILHDEVFSSRLLEEYTDEPYFRLKHDLSALDMPRLPAGFSVCEVSCRVYAEHINRCYSDVGISEAELHSYTQRKVYCRDLWVAVYDIAAGKLVATGIAELDREVREGMLEWIQVSPEYRRRGLGTFLVLELLRRMRSVADFVTVSGQCRNPASAEMLYRKCCFTGADVWHILRRKEEHHD